jgi:transcription elongation factor GreB
VTLTTTNDEIRFGALVNSKIGGKTKLQQYQIVGVDEADISKENHSFPQLLEY